MTSASSAVAGRMVRAGSIGVVVGSVMASGW
jgi:hypothetical protein